MTLRKVLNVSVLGVLVRKTHVEANPRRGGAGGVLGLVKCQAGAKSFPHTRLRLCQLAAPPQGGKRPPGPSPVSQAVLVHSRRPPWLAYCESALLYAPGQGPPGCPPLPPGCRFMAKLLTHCSSPSPPDLPNRGSLPPSLRSKSPTPGCQDPQRRLCTPSHTFPRRRPTGSLASALHLPPAQGFELCLDATAASLVSRARPLPINPPPSRGLLGEGRHSPPV